MLAAKPAPPQLRTITAQEAEQYLRIPAGTVRAWASQGLLHPVAVVGATHQPVSWYSEREQRHKQKAYSLADVLNLADTTGRLDAG